MNTQAQAVESTNGVTATEVPDTTETAAAAEATPATEVAATEVASDTPFDLDGLLNKIAQSAPGGTYVRRYLVGYLAGLFAEKECVKFKKELVKKHGAAATDLEAFDAYASGAEAAKAWTAFAAVAYDNVSVADASAKYGANQVVLQTMVDSNVLGLFANWASWPKKELADAEKPAAPVADTTAAAPAKTRAKKTK